ncbi:MAG: hypothetical protein EAZ23_14465 [Oscillatoriales cyanobacterium]|nr:MAG: hypothetical protein EAZ23_14465 [Oscillatoriales cyanobacterium]
MQETKDNSLFAELTPEESASVNGGYYYADRYYGGENCGKLWSSAPLGCVPPQLRRFLQKSSSLRLLVKFSALNSAL